MHRNGKERTQQYDDLGKPMKVVVSREKLWGGFNLVILKVNKFTMIE